VSASSQGVSLQFKAGVIVAAAAANEKARLKIHQLKQQVKALLVTQKCVKPNENNRVPNAV
jgi:hypothetical protein